MEIYILRTKDDNDTKRNILGIWTYPRVTSEEGLFVMKDLTVCIDIETWNKGIRAFSIWKLKVVLSEQMPKVNEKGLLDGDKLGKWYIREYFAFLPSSSCRDMDG